MHSKSLCNALNYVKIVHIENEPQGIHMQKLHGLRVSGFTCKNGGRVILWENATIDRDKALPNKLGRGLQSEGDI